MKKFIAAMLVVIMALSLAACSAKEEEPETDAPETTENGQDTDVNLDELKTPAEESNWERTTSSEEVLEFCKTHI